MPYGLDNHGRPIFLISTIWPCLRLGRYCRHTGMLGVDVSFDIPVVSIAAEDQRQLERYLERGESPRLHLDVQRLRCAKF
jgi:hypothetical protein